MRSAQITWSAFLPNGAIRGVRTITNLQFRSELNLLAVLADPTDWVVHKPFDVQDQHGRKRLDEHLLGGFG